MHKNKKLALEILKQKINGEVFITYKEIADQTNYSKRQLIRLSKEIEKRDIDSILMHGNNGKVPSNKASDLELNYIAEFKKQYLEITISQFMDIYHEDIIWNKNKIDDVLKNNLKLRSYSFFENLYHKYNWIIPRPHRPFNNKSIVHMLREPSPRCGILIIVDGTPHDWFRNGKKQSLHLAIDDATGEFLAGWFMNTETLEGYCRLFYIILIKYGIPISIYADKYAVFKSPTDKNLTTFGIICKELGIEIIYANSPEAKGKVEKANDTIQQRLLNDIKRFKITSTDQLNDWFNSYYCDYLNNKFSYEPKDNKSEFVPLSKSFKEDKLIDLFSSRTKRKILNGNSISIDNIYYVPVDFEGNPVPMYKGSTVSVWKNIITKEVKIFKNKVLYGTKKIEGHRQNEELRQLKVNNKKELNNALDAVYSSQEERKRIIQSIVDRNALTEKKLAEKIKKDVN